MYRRPRGYSVKPGRSNSAAGAAAGVFGIAFAIIWTVAAMAMGAPWFFRLFGVFFVGLMIYTTIHSIRNATGKNRYSEYDIVDMDAEPDPWDERYAPHDEDGCFGEDAHRTGRHVGYCPYCGAAVQSDFAFCRSCGKPLPE